MRAVDTNVLVRLLARDDLAQVTVAEEFVRLGAWVSHVVLVEATWVMTSEYGVKPGPLAAGVRMLLDHESLVVQEPDVVVAALDQYRKRPAVGFSDCLILELARKAGHLPLGTFDKVLGKRPDVQRLPG